MLKCLGGSDYLQLNLPLKRQESQTTENTKLKRGSAAEARNPYAFVRFRVFQKASRNFILFQTLDSFWTPYGLLCGLPNPGSWAHLKFSERYDIIDSSKFF